MGGGVGGNGARAARSIRAGVGMRDFESAIRGGVSCIMGKTKQVKEAIDLSVSSQSLCVRILSMKFFPHYNFAAFPAIVILVIGGATFNLLLRKYCAALKDCLG